MTALFDLALMIAGGILLWILSCFLYAGIRVLLTPLDERGYTENVYRDE